MFESLKHEITAAAQAALPNELCGVVVNGAFIPLVNVHPDPQNHFMLSDADTARYFLKPGTVQAFVHSHPPLQVEGGGLLGRTCPSAADMRQQDAMQVPWLIAAYEPESGVWEYFDFGRHVLDLPLLERDFRHGVEDCYTIIRKWWWQNKAVLLPEYPRDDGWWGNTLTGEAATGDLYRDGFKGAGFERFWPDNPGQLRPGDVFLTQLGTGSKGVYNHGGVFIGNGLIAHHPPNKLSCTASVGPRFRRVDFWLRRGE